MHGFKGFMNHHTDKEYQWELVFLFSEVVLVGLPWQICKQLVSTPGIVLHFNTK